MKAEADAEKADADARSAAAKARSDERDAAQAESALGQKQRDAASRQKIAEADKATSTAQADRIATYLPDLGKIERGKLDLEKVERPLFAAALENRALNEAAIGVATSIKTVGLTKTDRVLVTSDAELAASHAAHLEVMGALDQIDTAATRLLADLAVPGEADQEQEEDGEKAEPEVELEVLPIGAIAQAVATVLPGALSLFAAHRAVATSETTVEDLEAAAATAGALLAAHATEPEQATSESPTIVHDGFRLLADGPLRQKLVQLNTHRQDLVSRQLALGDEKARLTKDLALAKAKLEAAKADFKASPDDQAAKNQVETSTDDVADTERKLAQAELRLGLVMSAIEAIDAFSNSLTEVPNGAVRSPLTLATMREHLQPRAKPKGVQRGTEPATPAHFTHILLVKGNGGSTTQVIDDRALWMADRFASVGTARITYMLIETMSSAVLAAGDASGAAKASGKLSTKLSLELKPAVFQG